MAQGAGVPCLAFQCLIRSYTYNRSLIYRTTYNRTPCCCTPNCRALVYRTTTIRSVVCRTSIVVVPRTPSKWPKEHERGYINMFGPSNHLGHNPLAIGGTGAAPCVQLDTGLRRGRAEGRRGAARIPRTPSKWPKEHERGYINMFGPSNHLGHSPLAIGGTGAAPCVQLDTGLRRGRAEGRRGAARIPRTPSKWSKEHERGYINMFGPSNHLGHGPLAIGGTGAAPCVQLGYGGGGAVRRGTKGPNEMTLYPRP